MADLDFWTGACMTERPKCPLRQGLESRLIRRLVRRQGAGVIFHKSRMAFRPRVDLRLKSRSTSARISALACANATMSVRVFSWR